MIVFFSILVIVYCLMLAMMMWGWLLPHKPNGNNQTKISPFISIVIPVRNEIENICTLLDDLDNQDYPSHLYEVIVIDDHSDDGTYEMVSSVVNKYVFELKMLRLPSTCNQVSTKKKAMQLGVEAAQGAYILTTDGDCRVPTTWISSYQKIFSENDINFAAGMVAFHGERNIFQKLQSMEFAVLTGIGASTIQLGMPTMCNAANMAYRKRAFLEVEGYKHVDHIISGDDGFLLEKLVALDKSKLRFLKDKNAIIHTKPQATMIEFYHQRKRWASKWRWHKNPSVIALAVFIFLFHSMWLSLLGLSIGGYCSISAVAILLLIKIIFDFAFLKIMYGFLDKKLNFVIFLLMEAIYPIYAVFFGIAANIGGFRWKDRKYNFGKTNSIGESVKLKGDDRTRV